MRTKPLCNWINHPALHAANYQAEILAPRPEALHCRKHLAMALTRLNRADHHEQLAPSQSIQQLLIVGTYAFTGPALFQVTPQVKIANVKSPARDSRMSVEPTHQVIRNAARYTGATVGNPADPRQPAAKNWLHFGFEPLA